MNSSTTNPVEVSVIIPCYKQAAFLPQAIDSVLDQTLRELECIVVNDGSPDNTRDVVADYLLRDNRVRYVEQTNRGVSSARNQGLAEARGRYIQFLDADDLIGTEKLQVQTELLHCESTLALSFSDYRCCDRDDINKPASRDNLPPPEFIMDNPLEDLIARWETQFSIPPHCFLFDARFFTKHGIRFDETLTNHEDWDCWMQIFRLKPVVRRVPQKFAIYRLHDESVCGKKENREKMWEGYRAALEKQCTISRNEPELRSLLKKKLREVRKSYGMEPLPLWKRLLKKLGRIYRQKTPWPIQQAIIKLNTPADHNPGRDGRQ
ncbi:MAG: glycosyltransferase family 2 protein [Gammaproteobacteria bacterium]|nr:glycosyltransferase family 2 protein [Gammaproteobacteria bacterium]